MSFIAQVRALRARRALATARLVELLGMARPNLVRVLGGKHDVRASTLEGLAAALDAEWVLVPKEQLEAVQRILTGKDAEPDWAAKSAVDLYLEGRT